MNAILNIINVNINNNKDVNDLYLVFDLRYIIFYHLFLRKNSMIK